GGMGEVYRARDTRLGRDVAVKVLPASFASDPERLRRFEQEARAVAALNHPNILAVYDIGAHGGAPYLVTELLEGETLRERLVEGAVPVRKAIDVAVQAAHGAAAAHEKGIIHRDLKPANIFLTNDGRVKILDFGLAKLTEKQAQAPGETQGVTLTAGGATEPGVVLGTVGYMSPEQVRGKPADGRSDIFALGTILYEMLSGRRAFEKDSSADTMAAILKEEPPDLAGDGKNIPPAVDRIVRHCLEKNPAERFQSARDLTFALGTLSGTAPAPVVSVAPPQRRIWMFAGLGVLATLLVASIAYLMLRPSQSNERAEFEIAVPGEVSHLAISSDGRWLAFVSPGESGSEPMVYVERIGTTNARPLAGSEGASYPFWSPDDAYVAFFAEGKLKKAAIAGGEPQNLANLLGSARGGSWGSKGVIIYAPDSGGPLWRVNADGTDVAPLTDKLMAARDATHRWPFFLPDGDHFLMYAGGFTGENRANGIYISSLSKREKVELVSTLSNPGYADGRLYYLDANGSLVAAPLDLRAEKVTGEPRMIVNKLAYSPATYFATFAVSENSAVIYSANNSANRSQLTWLDETGKELGRVGQAGVLANPALSPDGRQVAYDSDDFKTNNVDVWISDLARDSNSRFTFDPSEEAVPTWSRDGSTIAYRGGSSQQVHLKKANGLEPARSLARRASEADDILPNSWSLDDKEILCTYEPGKGSYYLVLAPADGSPLRPFLKGAGSENNGQISPDGKWVAYASNESGDWEIYVTTFPGAAGKWQVSHGGGTEPRWNADGKEIFYLGPKQMLTAVPVSTEGTFSTGAPRQLFQIHGRAPVSSTDIFTYDVSRDGKRFLVNEYVKPEHVPPLSIVFNATGATPK
ncbi:MAG: serine/threonine-protein kinase, partial [Acidobacteriota bacterium]|nr:serine/threonine-protein kinase [Acidobacteriota bacterium]